MAGDLFVIHVPDLGGDSFEGTTDVGVSRATSVTRPIADGNPIPGFGAVISDAATIAVTGYDIATGLTLATVAGADLSDVVIYEAKLDTGGGKASGNVHVKHTMAKAFLVPRRLSAAHGQNARLTLEAVGYSTTGGSPLTSASSQGLSADTGGAAALYTLGPIKINGTAYSNHMAVDVDFGIALASLDCDGDIGTKLVRPVGLAPVITVSTYDPTIAAAINAGLAASSTGVEIWLRKRTNTGFSTSTDHVKLTAALAIITSQGTSGSAGGAVRSSWRVEPFDTGSDANPLVFATAALPT